MPRRTDTSFEGGGVSHLRLSLVIVLTFVVLAVAFLSFSRELTGQDYLKDFVLEQLEESLGRKIDVHRVKFVIFPRIRVELADVKIHDPESEQVVLTAKRVDLVLRLLPLLQKQVVGKRLLIEEPTLTLRRNEGGRWNVLDGLSGQADADQQTMDMMARTLMIREATLVNGTITVIDAARPDGIRSLKLERVEFRLMVRPDRGLAEVLLSASHQGESGVSAVSLDGVIKRAEPSVSLSGESTTGSAAGFQFEGQIDAADLKIRDVADFLGPRPVSEHLQGALNLKSTVRVMPGVAGYDMVLSDMTAHLNNITLKGKANLDGLLTPQPTFAVTFGSSLVALPQLLKTIPPDWIHPQLPALLADRQIDGKVQVMNATLTGTATTGPQLSTIGEFHVSEGRSLIGSDRIVAKDLAAVVVVETGRVRITKVTGMYGAMQITGGNAEVSFVDAGPWLELEITGETAATHLVEYFVKTVKAERARQWLAGIRDAEGTAQSTFRLVGPLNQSGGITYAGGEITLRQVSLTHVNLPERVTGMRGRFVLADGSTQFDQVTGHLGGTAVQVQGTITGGTTSRLQDVVIRTSGDAAHMARLFRSSAIEEGALEGTVSSTVTFTGSTARPHLRGSVVLDDTKIALGAIQKPVGPHATVEFEGVMPQAASLKLHRVELVLPSVTIPAKGTMQFGNGFMIDMAVATGTVSVSSLPEWILKGGLEAGNIEVSLDVKGKEPDWKTWRVTGWMGLTNGLMQAKGVEGHIQDLYARVKFLRNEVELKRLSFTLQGSDIAVEAAIRNWQVKPTITGKIESNQLDMSLVIPKGERTPIREFLETLAATSQVTMSVAVAHGRYKHLKFGSLAARLNIQDGVLDIDRLSGNSTHGHVAGRLVVQLPPKAPADLDLSFRATGVEFEDLLKLTKAHVHGVSGEVRVSGVLRGHGRNPHGVYPSLNGRVELLMENGRILKSNEQAVWKIISLLNLPAVLQGKVDLEKEGLPYNRISATIAIQNGMFQTENLIIDSPILKITAAGNYDLPTDQVDLAVAVSPFGSYSLFLKTIPLFGRIVAGDRKGIATAMFTMKGAMEDPEVTYLPVKSFASGLSGLAQLAVDVLTNTLTLPIDLVTPDEESGVRPKDMIPSPAPAVP
ncbi:MAG: AsmA-like C-terminal domain-containing protein [Nitrospira sp.]|nr:AsmA-like C-terminal domain-containing protein [Nitrospira sp.]